MNIPQGNKDTEVADWECILATKKPLPDLRGWECVAGIDYARSNDFVVPGLLFKKGDMRYWMTHSFVCRRSADLSRIKAPIDEWERMGLLTFIDDVEINPIVITSWLSEMAIDHNIIAIGIDQFRYSLFSSALEKLGFDAKGDKKNIKLIRPSNQQYVEPVINTMFLNNQLTMGDNPLMRWYINNTKKAISAHGNFSYEKIEPHARKNDGFMALVSAMCLESEIDSRPEPAPMMGAFVF